MGMPHAHGTAGILNMPGPPTPTGYTLYMSSESPLSAPNSDPASADASPGHHVNGADAHMSVDHAQRNHGQDDYHGGGMPASTRNHADQQRKDTPVVDAAAVTGCGMTKLGPGTCRTLTTCSGDSRPLQRMGSTGAHVMYPSQGGFRAPHPVVEQHASSSAPDVLRFDQSIQSRLKPVKSKPHATAYFDDQQGIMVRSAPAGAVNQFMGQQYHPGLDGKPEMLPMADGSYSSSHDMQNGCSSTGFVFGPGGMSSKQHGGSAHAYSRATLQSDSPTAAISQRVSTLAVDSPVHPNQQDNSGYTNPLLMSNMHNGQQQQWQYMHGYGHSLGHDMHDGKDPVDDPVVAAAIDQQLAPMQNLASIAAAMPPAHQRQSKAEFMAMLSEQIRNMPMAQRQQLQHEVQQKLLLAEMTNSAMQRTSYSGTMPELMGMQDSGMEMHQPLAHKSSGNLCSSVQGMPQNMLHGPSRLSASSPPILGEQCGGPSDNLCMPGAVDGCAAAVNNTMPVSSAMLPPARPLSTTISGMDFDEGSFCSSPLKRHQQLADIGEGDEAMSPLKRLNCMPQLPSFGTLMQTELMADDSVTWALQANLNGTIQGSGSGSVDPEGAAAWSLLS